jgi:DNA adenine methylase
VENLWCLNRIQSLELSTEQQIEFASFDYRDYEHEEGDVVYCDPPYAGTGKYDKRDFDHEAFYDWVRTRDFPVYFSEYNAPDDFACVWEKGVPKKMAGGKTAKQKATEHLFIHSKWKEN